MKNKQREYVGLDFSLSLVRTDGGRIRGVSHGLANLPRDLIMMSFSNTERKTCSLLSVCDQGKIALMVYHSRRTGC